jgi:D-alanine-D-alanine ligase
MNITVLYGGPSSERKISLISGKAVADALAGMGHRVHLADIMPDDLSPLDHQADVIFPVLHGAWGESGELQAILEQHKVPFVGSGSRASRLGMDKVAAKVQWKKAGLLTPAWRVIESADAAPAAIDAVGLPCVVKVIDGGSSIDVYICQTRQQATEASQKLVTKCGRAMLEQFIAGKELTIGILNGKALPPIWVKPRSQFYDFNAKYEADSTEYLFDLGVDAATVRDLQQLAVQAHKVLGCRHLSRVDIMLDQKTQKPYLLEINTLPGFTSHSLLPKAAKQTGLDFGPLVDTLVRLAYAEAGSNAAAGAVA